MRESRHFRKELMQLAIPLALQNLLNALVGASDALMLGRLNQDSIAAVALANQISFVLSLFNGAVIGAIGVLVAQYWGKKDYDGVKRFLAMALRYVGCISLFFFAVTFIEPNSLMRIFTKDAAMIEIGAGYLRIVSFSYLFAGISQCFLMMMKVSGNAKLSVIISAVTVSVDMFADFFLIYGKGPVPALGANGSAYSTIVVEAVALIWCLVWSCRDKKLRLQGKHLTYFSKSAEREIWKIIPGMLASSLSWGLSMTLHSFILGHMGSAATAAGSVTSVAQQMIQCVTAGLSAGAAIMIGKLLGQNMLEEAKNYGKRFWKVAFISGVINIGLMAIAGPLVYMFYALEPLAKTYLVQMLLFSAVYMFAYAYNTIITCGVFPAGGDSAYDAISVFFATWCFAIPCALIACFVLHWPVIPVYIIMCLDEVVKVPFIRGRYNKYIWVKNLTETE